jgi:hypothetical protein
MSHRLLDELQPHVAGEAITRAAPDNILRVGLNYQFHSSNYGDFRFWHKADIESALSNVAFGGKADMD